MRADDEYFFDVSGSPDELLGVSAERIFDTVWRADFTAPGFCLLDRA